MTQIIPYRNKPKKGSGLIEYLMLQKPSTSAILASLLMASFLTATILPWITTTEPVKAGSNKTSQPKKTLTIIRRKTMAHPDEIVRKCRDKLANSDNLSPTEEKELKASLAFNKAKQDYYAAREKVLQAEKTLISSESIPSGLRKMTRKCYWKRYIYNGYEPDHVIIFCGIETDTPGKFVADELTFFGGFNDGAMSCSVTNMGDGTYRVIVDDKEAFCDSFDDAWEKLPALLTYPDHYEESEVILYQE